MSIRIKPLQAFNGDSLLLSFDDNGTTRNILIDGGPGNTYSKPPKTLKKEIEQIKTKGESIDLLVITHIDDDHIGGIIRMFEYEDPNRDIIQKVWFNSGQLISTFFKTEVDKKREVSLVLRSNPELSVGQGINLENFLKEMNYWEQKVIHSETEVVRFFDSQITILSPNKKGLEEINKKWETERGSVYLSGDKRDYEFPISELVKKPFEEDSSVPNGSSISFIFEFQGKKILFLADTHPSVVAESLKKLGYSAGKKLDLDLVKVSHHSSKKNTSPGLLELIKCDKYLISTNGQKHGLPDKEAMARIIAADNEERTCIYFNYDIAGDIFLPEDYRDFDFKWEYLSSKGIELV